MPDNVDHLYLTRDERNKLATMLGTVADWLADALDETAHRQTSHTAGPLVSMGRAKHQPLPFHWGAADVAWTLENTITTWARSIEKATGLPRLPRPLTALQAQHELPRPLTTVLAAQWIIDHLTTLARMTDAAQAYDELAYAIAAARTVVDLPRIASYLGPCRANGCDGELWAEPDEDPVACRTCKAATPRAVVEQVIERELRARLCTANELVTIVADRLGLTVTPKMIRELTRRRRPLIVRGQLPVTGEHLYRAGDVLEAFIPRQRHRTRARLPTMASTTRRSGV